MAPTAAPCTKAATVDPTKNAPSQNLRAPIIFVKRPLMVGQVIYDCPPRRPSLQHQKSIQDTAVVRPWQPPHGLFGSVGLIANH
jgi:hypothetical protein